MRPSGVLLAVAALAMAADGAQRREWDWPQLGRDPQRTNYTPEPVGRFASIKGWEMAWAWKTPDSPVAIRTQVVAAEGVVAVGTHDGRMHCLDFATGKERWAFQGGGAILHSAAIGDGKVYFASHDGKVYAVRIADGERAWSFQTGFGIVAAPLLVDGNVYVGSKDGCFYALRGADGRLLWRRDIGEPITTSAAYSAKARRLFFGTVAVRACALDITDGSAAWTRRLDGQSMQEAWPQVSDRHGVVIFRVLSPYDMWDNLRDAGRKLEKIGGDSREREQNIISAYLTRNPHRRTFYALRLSDGTDRYPKPVPALWTWGVSSPRHAQAIDDEHDRCWTLWRTRFEATRDTADTGKLNLGTGRFEPHRAWDYVKRWGNIMSGIPADEPRPLAATPDAWLTCQSFGPSGCYILTGQCFTTCKWGGWMEFHDRHYQGNWAGMWPKAWVRGLVSPIWTRGRLLWNGHGGIGCLKLKGGQR